MADTLLKVQGLHRRFGGFKAVNNLSLDVGAGEIVGLLGPNGSGKTTAINLISGVIAPEKGSIQIDSHDIAGKPAYRSEEHTSELQSLMRIPYAVFCLKKKTEQHT